MSTRREAILEAKIKSLETKLEHAEKWMTRQVEETAPQGGRIYRYLHPEHTFSDRISRALSRLRHFHIFRRKYTLAELWQKRLEAFLMGAAIILFWRGIWNLADHYLFPNTPDLSAFVSLFIGMGLMILMRGFVNQFLDEAVEEAEEYE